MPPLTDVVKNVRPGQTGFFTSPSLHCMVVVSSCWLRLRHACHRMVIDRLNRGSAQFRQELVIHAISILRDVLLSLDEAARFERNAPVGAARVG
jgi:hypothetical protein